MFYKNNTDINKLLYEQTIKYLKEDIYKIVKASELIKYNKDISQFILNDYPKFYPYVNCEIKNN